MSSDPLPLPADVEAEENVLGAMLLSSAAIIDVSELLEARHFYRGSHAMIFDAILELDRDGVPVDLVTLRDHLDELGVLEKVGGAARIAELGGIVPAASSAPHYARIVREQHTLRELLKAAHRLRELVDKRGKPTEELVADAERMILDISTDSSTGELEHVAGAVRETVTAMQEGEARAVTGVPSGLTELDGLTAGFQPGNLIVVAARPSMGKSALVLGWLAYITGVAKAPTALFSVEMTKAEVAQRLLSRGSNINLQRMRTNDLDADEWSRLLAAAGRISGAPFYIDDDADLRLTELRARARRLKARVPDLALIAVDYLQLLVTGDRHENRNAEVAAISRGLKGVARELGVPVIALAQLNRKLEDRADKRPTLGDLRDSGAIEQDADVVIFLHRDDYHDRETTRKGIAELIVAKQRNGPTATAEAVWKKATARFDNPS